MDRGRTESHKIFCIGLNKTGTTSLEHVFRLSGVPVGDYPGGEVAWDLFRQGGNVSPIREHIRSATFFNDVPYSLPGFFRQLAEMYPAARFILTTRSQADVWVQSITRFHAKVFGSRDRHPTFEELAHADYRRRGWILDYLVDGLHVDPDDPYNRQHLVRVYEKHLDEARHFFRDCGNFLEINIQDPNALASLHAFFPETRNVECMPWLNRT